MNSRKILITGASTGIGAGLAEKVAPQNTLYLHYNRSEKQIKDVADKVVAAGGHAQIIQADLSSEQGCEKLYEEVSAGTENLDVLVNNAGGMVGRQKISDYQWSFFEEVFRVNLFSAMKTTSLFLPLLEKGQDPNIVYLTSSAARRGAPGATIYAATKGALDTLIRGSAKELAPGIRVNGVAPGVVDTPFHEKVNTDMSRFIDITPLRRNGRVEDVVSAIELVISNTFMTGETIDINGGMNMR